MTDLMVQQSDEFFIAVAKRGIHSFVMLGVVIDGQPQLLARVGKTNDIDPHSNNFFAATAKAATAGTLARIADEGLSRSVGVEINYQAYAINYEQYKEFLELIAEIEKDQLENPRIRAKIDAKAKENEKLAKGKTFDDERIYCYVPHSERKDGFVKLRYLKLEDCSFRVQKSEEARAAPKSGAKVLLSTSLKDAAPTSGVKELHINNTCRTSALNILEAVLGFKTSISKYFFVSPNYQTKLNGGNKPDKDSFYILPAPPTTYKDLSKKQISVLEKLYSRLEEIPKMHAKDPEKTKAKFNALKSTYTEFAGKNNLSANDFLQGILEHAAKNDTALNAKRAPNFLSKLLGISSTTERMFKDIKKEFEKEKSNDSSVSNTPSSP